MTDWMTSDFWRDRGDAINGTTGTLWEIIERNADRTPAMVRQVPERPGQIDAGHQTVIHWDPDGPVQIGCALTHPSPEFFAQRAADARAEAQRIRAWATERKADLDALEAQVAAVKTVQEAVALTVDGVDADGAPAPSVMDQVKAIKEGVRQAALQAAALDAGADEQALYIAAHKALPARMPSLDDMIAHVTAAKDAAVAEVGDIR